MSTDRVAQKRRAVFRLAVLGLVIAAMFAEAYGAGATTTEPDLTGTYDIATLYPLQRPAAFGENKFLSPQEAEAIRQSDAERKAKDNEASDPNREAPPIGGDGSPGRGRERWWIQCFWIDNGNSTFQVDGKFRTSIVTKPENGRLPELTPAGKKREQNATKTIDPIEVKRGGWLEVDKDPTTTWS